jgi:hypothetical protein
MGVTASMALPDDEVREVLECCMFVALRFTYKPTATLHRYSLSCTESIVSFPNR